MKKLWNQYSYAIILVLLSCSFAIILAVQNSANAQDKYVKVTVSQGDSLWKIAQQYSDQLSISNAEFVSWVKEHNSNIDDQIYPGDVITIPVSKDNSETPLLASGVGN
ncbi:LysM peptidoglycan-binding domain-containing protein [Bacillus sp. BRMEA1]|uniref:cell division suppressor protein YneA n=1 Tax=Neobacillus endophyticus TaxID=2738405 RepID=UPI001565D737|nr:LysM peptidoglycan-binding domain-containing protein [Neobacillus endophyticus]NRD79058.1 LysM peptidoglycan-binding domain-containing protein [Neobacillus endophyticus]